MSRVLSYVVLYDYGFAPNPFYGWCTLATCKPQIRASASVGDWIVGTGAAANHLQGRLVYAMRVEEILGFQDYWDDPRFQAKRPVRRGSLRQRHGDNIYHRGIDDAWIQENSRHSRYDGSPNPDHIRKDTSADAVLVSSEFWYFGGSGPRIPKRFRAWEGPRWTGSRWDASHTVTHNVCSRWKTRLPNDFCWSFVEWIQSLEGPGYLGDPANW